VDLYGSAVYAPEHAADVDVLVSHKDATRLAADLSFELILTNPPRLRGVLYGVDVDVRVVNGTSDDARRMRLGPRDAALLAARRTPAFDAAWPHVLRFVQLRALGTNGLGYFGSFGWALLLAIALAGELHEIDGDAVLPAWFRWLARIPIGSRVGFDGVRRSDGEPLYIEAPGPPSRDVARLSRRTARHILEEARLASNLETTNEDAIRRLVDIARDPPTGTTIAITGDDEASRGRYEGMARGLLRELEELGPTRSWGRFDVTADGWQHCITVQRVDAALALVEHRLAVANIDAIVEPLGDV
jgi:hypothetical protein